MHAPLTDANPFAHDVPVLLPPRSTGDPAIDDVEVRSGGDYPRRPVEWLWPNRIPLGKVTLLAGDPGLGKSLVALDVAARVTRGLPWPEESSRHTPCAVTEPADNVDPTSSQLNPEPRTLNSPFSPGSVLVLTTEDDVGDTIRPRLEAHGANVHRVFFVPKIADLRHDFAKLVAALDRIPDCRLIIVDPVNAFVGPSDSHFHTVARRVLAPLAELAAQRGIAILAVTHFRKNEGAAIYRATGSMGFVAAARAVWTICRDKSDPRRRLLLPVKNNLAPLGDGLAYSIEPHESTGAPALRWEPQAVTTSAEEAFAPGYKPRGPEAEDRQAASEWLVIALARGPRSASEMIEEGKRFGLNPRTLRRGLQALGGQTNYGGIFKGWTWSLPAAPRSSVVTPVVSTQSAGQHPPIAVPKKPVPLKETCPLTGNNAIEMTLLMPPDVDYLLSTIDFQPPSLLPTADESNPSVRADTLPLPPTPKPPHPLNGHPVIDQILWRLRTPMPEIAPPQPATTQQCDRNHPDPIAAHSPETPPYQPERA